jgi:hypothetical protein
MPYRDVDLSQSGLLIIAPSGPDDTTNINTKKAAAYAGSAQTTKDEM